MNKIICGQENVDTFRAEMRAHVPAFYNLAKELYAAGMIEGLRGATIEILPLDETEAVQLEVVAEAIRTCEGCGQWRCDTIGDGSGIGRCLLNARSSVLKWPKQTACEQFEVVA
jgi:predicted hotdog family 3-hydroxylacyl-ACP dehydratase